MKKIIFTALIIWVLVTASAIAGKIDCIQFDKVSVKYLECSGKNIKKRSSKIRLKETVGAEELKEKMTINVKNNKIKINAFKNNKSLANLWRNKYVI